MALDFVILGPDGRPRRSVPCEPAVHRAILAAAVELELRFLRRVHDYYQDAEFSLAELPQLASEIRRLRRTTLPEEAGWFLDALGELVAHGMSVERVVHALAD